MSSPLSAARAPLAGVEPIARRWIVAYVIFTILGTIATGAWFAREARDGVAAFLETNWMAAMLRPAAQASAWAEARESEASLLASVVREAGTASTVGEVVRGMTQRHGCVAAWLVTPDGTVELGRGDDPAAIRASHGAAWAREVAYDSTSARTIVTGGHAYFDLVARAHPVDRDEPLVVVLRYDLARADLPPVMLPVSRTLSSPMDGLRHTMLLVRAGDSVRAVRVGGGLPAAVTRRTIPLASLPPHVREAFVGRWTYGRGHGVFSPDAIFAIRPIPELGWAAIREGPTAPLIDASGGVTIAINRAIGVALALGVLGALGLVILVARLRHAQLVARMRSEFVASVSHEVRTPLTQVRMFAELLQDGKLRAPDDVARALRIIAVESQRLSILVDDILDFSAKRAPSTRDAAASARVRDAVRDTVDAFAPIAAERKVRVVERVDGDPVAAMAPGALRHVLTNLLGNAVKYGPVGQVVTIGAAVRGGEVVLHVDDQGPGVPVRDRARIWLPFERGGSAVSGVAGGYGIGLAVARELVTQYGGHTAVEDAPGGGARFVVRLPAAPVEPALPVAGAA